MPRTTLWKSDFKDGLVSKELAELVLLGKVKIVQMAKNFIIVEHPESLYEKIYPTFQAFKPLKHWREMFYWEKDEAPTEFNAIIAIDKLNLTELKKKLPYKWWKVLEQNDGFKDWLKTRKKYKSRYEDGNSIYVIETDEGRFYEKYSDDKEEYVILVEDYDMEFEISEENGKREIGSVYIYLKRAVRERENEKAEKTKKRRKRRR